MTDNDQNSRLKAFCDGVFAIALTLLIIDIKIPTTREINNAEELWLAIESILSQQSPGFSGWCTV